MRWHQALAFRAAYLITGDAAEAEDAAQEAFIKAYYHLSRFRSGAPFRPWLLTIVANEARNRRSATARRLDLVARAGARGDEVEEPSPERSLLAGERRSQLLAALNRLREEERLAVTCRYFLDLSEAEMAATLGCPRGTVKSRLSRALARLRGVLGGADGISAGEETPDG